MWTECLLSAPNAVPGVPVSPGDQVSVDIFLADSNGMTWFNDGRNGGLTSADTSVWFMIYNTTQGKSYWGTISALASSGDTSHTGTTAEFILERPIDTNTNTPVPLANFIIIELAACWYGDSQYGYNSWQLPLNGT